MGKGRFALTASQRGRPPSPIEDDNWKIAKTCMPDMPVLPNMDAQEEWGRIAPYLLALDRVSQVDRQALTAYCVQWSQFVRLMRERFTDDNVLLYTDGPSCEVIHPLLPPLLRAARSTIRLAGQFGMTARTRDLESDNGNRKASALKRLMGNRRKIAEGKLAPSVLPMLPDFSAGDMAPPNWMNDRAREEYNRLGRELEVLDLFTPLDLTPLAISSSLFDLYLRGVEQMTDLETMVLDKDGEVVAFKEHPLHKAVISIHDVLHFLWKDYGQTPRYRKVFNGEQKPKGKEIPLVFRGSFG